METLTLAWRKRDPRLMLPYAYSLLHILSWRIILEGNGHGMWEGPFRLFFALFFLPLNLLAGAMCRAVWGSFNLFEARYLFGMVWDVAIASLLSTTILVASAIALAYWRVAQSRSARRSGPRAR